MAMTSVEVQALMASATSWDDWEKKAQSVIADNGGRLPDFWYTDVYRKPEIQEMFHEWGRKKMEVRRNAENVFGKPITKLPGPILP